LSFAVYGIFEFIQAIVRVNFVTKPCSQHNLHFTNRFSLWYSSKWS